MAQTFDIRFARARGFSGFFTAPANRFGWKGAGKLVIDSQGIRVAVRRGFTNLFARRRSHRVAAAEITQVRREGEALRLEFGKQGERHVLPLWAAGNSAAEQIVKLLPTTSTVEFEHSTWPALPFRLDRTALVSMLAVVALACLGLWLLLLRPLANFVDVHGGEGPPVTSLKTAAPSTPAVLETTTHEQPLPANASSSPETRSDRDPTRGPLSTAASPEPLEAGDAGADSGLPTLPQAETDSRGEPATGYLDPVNVPVDSAYGWPAEKMWILFEQADGPKHLDWWTVTVLLHTTPEFQGPDLWALREGMLAVSRARRANDRDLAERVTLALRRDF